MGEGAAEGAWWRWAVHWRWAVGGCIRCSVLGARCSVLGAVGAFSWVHSLSHRAEATFTAFARTTWCILSVTARKQLSLHLRELHFEHFVGQLGSPTKY